MPEVLVIGGGLAGGAMATHLARAGREVLLVERERGPHDKVCGEFLSFEAQGYLREIGVDLPGLGAVPIGAVAVERGTRRTEAPLSFRALSLSRRVLDEAVLARAAEAGAEVRRGARATGLERTKSGWAIALDGGGTVEARDVVLATGKHDLRGWRRPPGRQPDLVGFKAYWRLADAGDAGGAGGGPGGRLDGTVELHLFPGGYAGLQMVEGGRANLCLVVRRATFAALGGRWDALLAALGEACPGLAVRLEGAVPCQARPLAIAAIPYGLVEDRSRGVWRLGDQAAVIPSFTGEGMSIALHSARLASAFLAAGQGPEDFQRRLARDLSAQVRRATLASRAMVAPLTQWGVARLLTPPLMRWLLRETRIPAAARPCGLDGSR